MRVALLGFSIECNRFAPVATERDFVDRTLLRGDALLTGARAETPAMLGELPGFVAAMDAAGAWDPMPLLLAMTEPNGPVDHAFFGRLMTEWEAGLRAALPVDAIYCVMHGAGLTTEDDDPEGTLLTMLRRVAGPSVRIVASFDLHANVTDADVDTVDAFVGYLTNPHMDMRARGAECAALVRRLVGGPDTYRTRIRLPIVSPPTALLTGADAPNRPYGELIDLGQTRMHEAPYAGRVLNVSVMAGFVYADTPFNGLTVVVTALDQTAANDLAREIAIAGWARRAAFEARLTTLPDAIRMARDTGDSGAAALIFADVADNPGGGGRGNTMFLLEALHEAAIPGVLVGLIHDPALATEAHGLGVGAEFTARFNRQAHEPDRISDFSRPFHAPARIVALHSGPVQARRGIFAGGRIDLGPCAALAIGGITVVVASRRVQCADPAFFEVFGLDIAAARVVVVKSRGHFRGGFDEFFSHGQVIEVDCPGLTSPMLQHFHWTRLPRPVLPLDPHTDWSPA